MTGKGLDEAPLPSTPLGDGDPYLLQSHVRSMFFLFFNIIVYTLGRVMGVLELAQGGSKTIHSRGSQSPGPPPLMELKSWSPLKGEK